jgi:hypothetical protein
MRDGRPPAGTAAGTTRRREDRARHAASCSPSAPSPPRRTRRSPYSPTQPVPSEAPAKTNVDVVAPLSAVQVASPEPEYPSSLQGKSNAPTPCREQHGCSGCARRQQTGAKAARLRTRPARSAATDQATATVSVVVLVVPVPADLSLFGMLIAAQVAAAGTGGARRVVRGFGRALFASRRE